MIRMLGGLIGRAEASEALAVGLERGLDEIRQRSSRFSRRPRVYFEEWDNPLISGIQWVEELIEIAGGDPIFPELRHAKLAKERIVQPDEVVRRRPDVIIASWCGKAVNKQKIASRAGWDALTAVQAGHIHEIKSALILQPGPASLTEGVRQLHEIMSGVQLHEILSGVRPRLSAARGSDLGDRVCGGQTPVIGCAGVRPR
jgi:iron complex transport system substrate-binding protein